jgi:cytochrome c2
VKLFFTGSLLGLLLACGTSEAPAEITQPQAKVTTPPLPERTAGEKAYRSAGCRACHLNSATGAPDLKKWKEDNLIAGTLDITRENMELYLLAPQDYVAGSIMPPTRLRAEKLNNLIDYLFEEL